MIETLETINSKSFDNYFCSEKLSGVNLFFGTNGSGKSALSKWIFSLDEEYTRVFDTEYVRNNILAEEGISGVRLTVGQDKIDIEQQLEHIRTANANLQNENNLLFNSRVKLKDELYNLLNHELNNAKPRFSTKKINQKPRAKDDPEKALQLWLGDIQDDSSQKAESLTELEQQLALEKDSFIKLQTVLSIDKERYDKFIKVLGTSISIPTEEITTAIASWIESGLNDEIHDMTNSDETCKFCGNNFDGPHLEETIKGKLGTNHAKNITALERLKNDLKTSKKKSTEIGDVDNKLFIEMVDKITGIIDKKINDTSKIFVVEENVWENLSALDKKIIDKKENLSQSINTLEKLILTVESLAKSWVGSQLKSNTRVSEMCSALKKCDTKIAENGNIIRSNNQWISEKQHINSDLQPFADLVNSQFEVLGLDFLFEVTEDAKSYNVKHKNSKVDLKPEDLSEGERRLVAFLHFYFDLFDEPDKSFVATLNTIIIDDPITSLDMENRYYLTELINKFIKEVKSLNKQLFIFTHSSLDFHNFGYGDSSVTHFRISKNIQGNSQIKRLNKGDLKNYSDYYKTFFEQLFEFAQMSKNKVNEVINFRQYANQARIVFESHARTHYKIENATSAESNLPQLYEAYSIEEERQQDFQSMLNIINSLSHGFSFTEQDLNEVPVGAVHKAVKQMFGILHKKDSAHVRAMIDKVEFKKYDNNKPENWF
ncbi:AAA family ATPase [Lactococcus formosensis subsp. formosensis]|uniref:AAA family ATPase n=1 Tax=Lactococcus formosensis TaxID=1281486 RepID=UPI00385444D8